MEDRVDELMESWQRELPSVLSPTTELTKRLLLLAGELSESTRRVLRELGLTMAEFEVLVALRRSGSPYRMKPSDLSRSLLLSSGGTSNVVNQLVNRSLVDRGPDPTDGRGTQITLTPAGVDLAERAVQASSAAHDEIWRNTPVDALKAATEALRDISPR